MVFDQKNIISISDFSKDDIDYILRLSEKMEPIARSKKKSNVLSGKMLGMLLSGFSLGEKQENFLLIPRASS